jgi:uncharacterized protein with gpF-like domain
MSRRDITRVIQTYIKKAEGLADSSSGDFLKVIDEWRQRVVLVLVEAGEVNPITDDMIKQRIDQINEQFRQKLEPVLTDNQRRLFIKGIQLVDKALEAGNIRTAMPYLSEQKLQRLNEYGAEHIKGLANYARSKIAQEIDLAVLGQKPQQQVIEAIGRKLDSASVFGTIAKRAQVILKTEVNRINQMATADRLKQVSIQVQDLKKRWIHSHIGIPRPGHLMLHLVTIEVKEKFELLGADGKIYYVDSPFDPVLPAGEVVNCRCKVIPVVERFEPANATG